MEYNLFWLFDCWSSHACAQGNTDGCVPIFSDFFGLSDSLIYQEKNRVVTIFPIFNFFCQFFAYFSHIYSHKYVLFLAVPLIFNNLDTCCLNLKSAFFIDKELWLLLGECRKTYRLIKCGVVHYSQLQVSIQTRSIWMFWYYINQVFISAWCGLSLWSWHVFLCMLPLDAPVSFHIPRHAG